MYYDTARDMCDETIDTPSGELALEVAARIPWLRAQLLAWFAQNGRSFPWREPGRAPYEVVVAEVLLQRTTAAGVARSYHGFFERYPSWTALAQASLEDIQTALRPLGLWRQRARVLQRLARAIEKRGGQLPCSRAALERLRGIGPYTASAVLAMVYGRAEPLVDVNMARVMGRFFALPAGSGRSRNRSLHALARLVVSGEESLRVNWAVLDFAALVCRARRPLCRECPLRTRCQYVSGDANLLPL